MTKSRELEKGPLTAGDLRRTVETRLAALGVTMELRSTCSRTDSEASKPGTDFLCEKRAALEELHRLLTGSCANVTSIKRRVGRGRRLL
jgi:hypothetical protein